jgi:RNA polymerase sigma factor (sigma-70 family)
MSVIPAPAGRPSSEEAGGRIAALFDAHGRMILGLCRFLLRDADEADDATQQTFLSAYRSLLSGTEPRNPAQWLAEIARNECRGRIAARMREPLPLAPTVEASGHDPAETADQTELIDELKAAIAELPERQREAVILRDFYGLSYREVATAMTVSVPVVESLLFRARRRLDRRLGTLPRLAQGALAVPLALREDLARAIPGFDAAAASLGITGGGAAAGVVAKLAAMPATAKVASATTVAAVAVGGATVTPQMIDRQPTKPAATTRSPAESAPEAPTPTRSASQVWDNRGRTRAKVGSQGAASGSAERNAAPELEEPSTESESSDAPEAETEAPAAEREAPEQEVEVEEEHPAAAVTPSTLGPQRVQRETESKPRETEAESESAEDEGSD